MQSLTSLSLRRHAGATLIASVFAAGAMCAGVSHAATLRVDASAASPAPAPAALRMGSAVAPNGDTLGVNARYLTRNGAPWLPVMGEFHYSRTPSSQWLAELQKMKTAGIDIVSSYVMWNHHEQVAGKFDWKHERNLRRFVQLAAQAGLDVVVRVGPWAHAEVRYGGVPDWVVNSMPTRSNDAQYLRHVEQLYHQIGQQLKGLLWKDGGRVIGIQLENEYNLDGPGQGKAHIATLKQLALKAGLDVPYYTVTGWDGTIYPHGEVTPVFGGYPDEPWGTSTEQLPPKETYAFRFDTRVSGDLGAQTAAHAPGSAETDQDVTPFLGAEYGAGLPFMYRRRTVVSADDIASMLPVQLGSGVNLMGYYMFHGGRNPTAIGGTSMEESTLSGGYNDTTMISYDFQAPLGPDGQQRKVLEKLRPFHLFLHTFGSRLAPMTVRKPERSPATPDDLQTPRYAVRSDGEHGFLFVNNHVRQYDMAPQPASQFEVQLANQTLRLPSKPVDIASGTYFIWPLNLDLDGTKLTYATAQPVTLLDQGRAGVTAVFSATAGVPVELALDGVVAQQVQTHGANVSVSNGRLLVSEIQPGSSAALTLQRPGARPLTIVVLTPEQAQQLSVVQLAGQRRLLLSAQQSYVAEGALQLRSVGNHQFRFAVYPPLPKQPRTDAAAAVLRADGNDGLFQTYSAELPARSITAEITPLRTAQEAPPVMIGGSARAAIQPAPESFKAAAAWRINVPPQQLRGLDDALLQIDFVGDIGRLFAGTRMLDDWYYSGYPWQVSLRSPQTAASGPLTVSVLPLRADAPIYLPRAARPDFGAARQMAQLRGVSVVPVYRLRVIP